MQVLGFNTVCGMGSEVRQEKLYLHLACALKCQKYTVQVCPKTFVHDYRCKIIIVVCIVHSLIHLPEVLLLQGAFTLLDHS